jgi:AraC-like DNA-binding protein
MSDRFLSSFRQTLSMPENCIGDLWRRGNGGQMHRPHAHEEVEMNYVLRGRASYLLKSQRYDLLAGMLVWLFPDQDHVLIDQSADYEMYVLVIRPSALKETTGSPGYSQLLDRDPTGAFCRALIGPARAQMERLLQQVAATRDDPLCFNAGLLFSTLAAWRAFQEASEQPLQQPVHPAVGLAVRLLASGSGDEDLNRLAAECGLSPGRLSRLFHSQLGVTLVAFRNRQRLERFSAIRSAEPDMTLLDTALEAGFGSYAQFYKVYRQAMGAGPAGRSLH